MVMEIIQLKVVSNDEFDDSFWAEDGQEVNPIDEVIGIFNDKPSDYVNFHLEKVE